MIDRVVLITGSTDGIGRQIARAIAAAGAKVILHGRSKVKVDATIAALIEELPGAQLEGVSFDLGSLTAVRRGAEQILARVPQLNVLINNAGIFSTERLINDDGIESTFAVDHIGPFLLTALLTPRLVASAALGESPSASRVINVSSIAHTRGRIHVGDLTMSSGWTGYAAYAQAKLANVMHALSLAERNDPAVLAAYSLHPGVIATKLLRQGFGPVQGGSPESGAKTPVRLALAEAIDSPSGAYFSDGIETQPSVAARDAKVRAELWDASVRLAKL